MSTLISSISKGVYNALPKNQYEAIATQLDGKIAELKQRLKEGTDNKEFLFEISTTHKQYVQKKAEIEQRLLQLNGKYEDAPDSLLHSTCELARSTNELQHKAAFEALLKERDRLQIELKQLLTDLNGLDGSSHAQLRLREFEIVKELHEIRGKGYGDKNSQIDKAWVAHQRGLAGIEKYQALEERRKVLEADRSCIQFLLTQPDEVGKTLKTSRIEQVVRDRIGQEIVQTTKARDGALDLVGIDYTSIAKGALVAVGILGAIGFVAKVSRGRG